MSDMDMSRRGLLKTSLFGAAAARYDRNRRGC